MALRSPLETLRTTLSRRASSDRRPSKGSPSRRALRMERLEDRCMLANSALSALAASPVAVHSPSVAPTAIVAASPQAQAAAKVTVSAASLASTTTQPSSPSSSALYNQLLAAQSALRNALSNLTSSKLPSSVKSALALALTNAINADTALLGLLSPTSNGVNHSTLATASSSSSSPSKSGMSTTSTSPSGLSALVGALQTLIAGLQAIQSDLEAALSSETSASCDYLAYVDTVLLAVLDSEINALDSLVSLLCPSTTS